MKSAKNDLFRNHAPLNVGVLVLDDCNTLSFAATVDPMRLANRQAGRTLFRWTYATATGAPALLTSGVPVPGVALRRLDRCELLFVVAGFALERHATPALQASLRRLAADGTLVAGVDGGPWLLAGAGLLDGYRATTHWEDLDHFATRFPAVSVINTRFHVDRDRMTCGGAMPALDMMLHLIESRWGSALAAKVAGAFIHDRAPNPDRAQTRRGARPDHNALTLRAEAVMARHIDAPLPIPQIARACATSPRTLQAQFHSRLGTTPQAFYLSLRLAEAHRLVCDTDLPLTEVSLITGFTSPAVFSRAFKAAFGCTARALRAQGGT